MRLLLKIVGLLLLPPDSMLRTKLFWKRFMTAGTTILIGIVLFANCGQPFVPERDAGCTDASCPTLVEVPPAPQETVVSGEDWEYVVSGPGWTKMSFPTDDKAHPQEVYIKGDKEAIVLLTKVEMEGGTLSQLVVGTVKEMLMGQAHLDSLEQRTINQVKFVKVTGHIHSDANSISVYIWIGVKDKFGYVMHCAGRDAPVAGSPAIVDLCESIGNTIQIN